MEEGTGVGSGRGEEALGWLGLGLGLGMGTVVVKGGGMHPLIAGLLSEKTNIKLTPRTRWLQLEKRKPITAKEMGGMGTVPISSKVGVLSPRGTTTTTTTPLGGEGVRF